MKKTVSESMFCMKCVSDGESTRLERLVCNKPLIQFLLGRGAHVMIGDIYASMYPGEGYEWWWGWFLSI